MPIYEYVCRACKHEFEALVYGSEQARCPECAGAELDKQFSAFAAPASGDGARADLSGPGCGTCGDPRGPGACAMSD
jgi:putative FmdB family regulatory protein